MQRISNNWRPRKHALRLQPMARVHHFLRGFQLFTCVLTARLVSRLAHRNNCCLLSVQVFACPRLPAVFALRVVLSERRPACPQGKDAVAEVRERKRPAQRKLTRVRKGLTLQLLSQTRVLLLPSRLRPLPGSKLQWQLWAESALHRWLPRLH